MISKRVKKKIYLILILTTLIILIIVAIFIQRYYPLDKISTNPLVATDEINNFEPTDFIKTPVQPETEIIKEIAKPKYPETYLIENVPFHAQAPYAVWDELHNEACEEAAIVLAKYYLDGVSLDDQEMDEQILRLVDWEVKNWGGHYNLSIAKTAELAENNYNIKTKIFNNANIDTLKTEIAKNHPVIVPAAGRLLGNPYFRQPGPVYHMLVVIGYDEKNMIVQELGNNHGANYHYNTKIFENAWHDWAGDAENIEQGAKNFLILEN